tara:strand:+ start:497 stop:655 length:159 start_codon:yes stop_codon:yes gene_type:complete
VQSHLDDKKEAVNDHPELSEAITALKESALVGVDNVIKVIDGEEDANKRVVN